MLCQHLEVSRFATYSIRSEAGVEKIMLQRCILCNAYLTFDSKQIPSEQIILEEVDGIKTNMRTITTQINSGLYEKLQDLIQNEVGTRDPEKIMSEIVALGIEQYKKALSPEIH